MAEQVSGSAAGGADRIEDVRFLTGSGRYVADCLPEGCLHAVFLRADRASARLARLAVEAARTMPGVAAVLTAADLRADGIEPQPPGAMPRDDGGDPSHIATPLLCETEVRYLGEPIAMIVAATREQAQDALEAIEIDLEDQPFQPGIAFVRKLGDAAAAEARLAASAHRITHSVHVPRLAAAPLETRGAVALPEPGGRLTFQTSTQSPFAVRGALARRFGWPEANLRVIAPDVGGSFGLKSFLPREEALVAYAARQLERPVGWIATRSESLVADNQGRGVSGRVTLGLDEDMRFTVVMAEFEIDAGAYPGAGAFGMSYNAAGITGPYRIPGAAVEIVGRLSPRVPLAPYRGAGRPEATLAIEQTIDAAARALGADPLALRRRNLLSAGDLPFRTPLGFAIDSGDFAAVFDSALLGADEARRASRRRKAESAGRLYGFGVAACLESAGGPVGAIRPDHTRIVVSRDGRVRLAAGVMSVGQGHETALTGMAASALGLPRAQFDYVNGDTEATAGGRGNGGSAGLCVGGAAMHQALGSLVAEGCRRAASSFGRAESEVRYEAGVFSVEGTNLTLSLAEIAEAEGGEWRVEAEFRPEDAVFPNGTHVCEVEIDPETGALAILRYRAVEDVGRVHAPALAEGQLQGGIAMGLAQVLGEEMRHDAAGQVLTGTLMDYILLRPDVMPRLDIDIVEVPTARNPLGAKGVGEAGTVGALAALMAAVRDALASAGVEAFDMPATTGRIWEALQGSRRNR